MPTEENEAATSTATERSPLLGQQHIDTSNGHIFDPERESRPADENAGGAANAGENDGEIALANEPSTKRLLATLATIWIGVYFAALDGTIVATLTGPISSSFNSLSLLSWLATAYFIANAACQPLSGKLTDIFSRRYGLVFSNVFFGLGTLLCGIAPDAKTMIAGRVIAGIGGGGLTCISTFVTSDLVPLRRRGVWQGYGNLIFGAGMGSGGLLGGLMADNLSWRWAFLIQLPFIAVSAVLVWFLVDIPVNPSKKPPFRRIDFLGSGLLVASVVFFLLGLNTGGNQVPWSHWSVITSLVLALGFFIAFVYVECSPRLAPEPVIPVAVIVRTRTILAACLVNWFGTMVNFLALYYVPLYLEIRGFSSTQTGLRIVPMAVGAALGSLISGMIMNATGHYWWLHVVFSGLMILGATLISTFQLDTPSWATFVYGFPLSLSYGSLLTVTLVAMISAVDHSYQAVITAASYAFRSTGSTIGITIAGAIFQNILTGELRAEYGDKPNAEVVIRQLKDSFETLKHLPEGWDKNLILDMYMDALRGAFLAALGLTVIASIVGLFMKEHVLHKNLARK